MEISRWEHGRSFHEGPPRLDFRRNSRFANSEPPINYNPWNKRFSPVDQDYQPEISHSYKFHRGPHPYHRNQPVQRPQPLCSNKNNAIPSLMTMELSPKPLLLPKDVEKLRANLRKSPRRLESEPHDDYDNSPLVVDEHLTEEEYLREEQETKYQIEEIIAVAQALREKLDREEELRRQAETSIPKLMDLNPQPKIPSLLEIYVPPPIPEEICWNCKCLGHRFAQCNLNKQRKFCYRCGARGFDVGSCPFCKNPR